jgi:hypothetical protein
MPSGVFKITDIPQQKVAEVEALYRLDNPIKIEKIDQGNNLWTVIATFPGQGSVTQKFSA